MCHLIAFCLICRNLVDQMKAAERRHVDRQHGPGNIEPQPGPGPVDPVNIHPAPVNMIHPAGPARAVQHDIRCIAAEQLQSSEESNDDNPNQQPPRRANGRKRSLASIVRENHVLYNRFLKKKLPKIVRELGISSTSSETSSESN